MPAALTTIAGVEIARVGTWHASTGEWVCTREQLASAVDAQRDPGYRAGVLKLGHTDPRFNGKDEDGQPALGKVTNLRLDETGDVLLGDLAGVPTWLAEIMPTAYPSRSIEASLNATSPSGRTYQMVLTGLALLGVTAPAIESLADIADLYGADTTVEAWVAASRVAASNQPAGGTVPTTSVSASASITDLQDQLRAWRGSQPGLGEWAWLREVWTDSIIVDGDDGRLWRVDWTEANGTFTFATPEQVQVSYVPVTGQLAAAISAARRPVLYSRGRAVDPDCPKEQHVAVEPATLRERLSLSSEASDDEVLAAIDALKKTPTETPAPATQVVSVPEANTSGIPGENQQADIPALVAAAVGQHLSPALAQIKTLSEDNAALKATEAARVKASVLDEARRAGKFAPADRAMWEKAYDEAPPTVTAILAATAPGTAVPVTAAGAVGGDEPDTADAEWAQISAALGLPKGA